MRCRDCLLTSLWCEKHDRISNGCDVISETENSLCSQLFISQLFISYINGVRGSRREWNWTKLRLKKLSQLVDSNYNTSTKLFLKSQKEFSISKIGKMKVLCQLSETFVNRQSIFSQKKTKCTWGIFRKVLWVLLVILLTW